MSRDYIDYTTKVFASMHVATHPADFHVVYIKNASMVCVPFVVMGGGGA